MDIYEYCLYCRNFFAPATKKLDRSFIHTGTFTISDHTIAPLDFILSGQYFRIVGSAVNDGVYCKKAADLARLKNETFTGAIWEMSVPDAFLATCERAEAWRTVNEAADSSNMSPFAAESFAGYSYQKGGTAKLSGNAISWQKQFEDSFNPWRRLNIL